MRECFDGGYGWADGLILRKIYQYEQISEEKKNEYIQQLIDEDSIKFSEFLDYKESVEESIINIKQCKLYMEPPFGKTHNTRFFEISDNGKIMIYLTEDGGKFVRSHKVVASHVLEQVFDEDDQLISEELKEL